MNRRDFLKASSKGAAGVFLAGTLGTVGFAQTAQNRPNILWIIAEDLSPDLGCYGNELVKTPNIDRLASQGAMYTNAFVTGPVCSASRSAFMTGMYQTSIDAHNHRSHREDGYKLPEPVNVITRYFRDSGYFTSNAGGGNWNKRGKTDFNFNVHWPFEGTDWRQRKQGQPFFSQMNFSETHRIFQRDPLNPIDADKVQLPPYYPDHPIARRDWANYLEDIQVLDRKVGKALERLESDGLVNNTVVMFLGDHGRAHIRGKQFLYDGGIRIPMIIRWPGRINPGTVVDDLVSAIDFAPTFMKIAGIEPPDHLQGADFLGPDAKKREYIVAARDRCDETVDRIRCVRTKRFKYLRNYYPNRPYTQHNNYKEFRYPMLTLMKVLKKQGRLTEAQSRFMASVRPTEELYDLANDPYEIRNLAKDLKCKSILQDMRRKLQHWIEQTNDMGRIAEPQERIEAGRRRSEQRYNERMRKRGMPKDVSLTEYLQYWQNRLTPDLD